MQKAYSLTPAEAVMVRRLLESRDTVDIALSNGLRLVVRCTPGFAGLRHAYIEQDGAIIADVHDLPDFYDRMFVTFLPEIGHELHVLPDPENIFDRSLDFTQSQDIDIVRKP